jgi:hypothetical protein
MVGLLSRYSAVTISMYERFMKASMFLRNESGPGTGSTRKRKCKILKKPNIKTGYNKNREEATTVLLIPG